MLTAVLLLSLTSKSIITTRLLSNTTTVETEYDHGEDRIRPRWRQNTTTVEIEYDRGGNGRRPRWKWNTTAVEKSAVTSKFTNAYNFTANFLSLASIISSGITNFTALTISFTKRSRT